jgi:hypothetical protein
MQMSLVHLHLLLNHFPIIGTMIATGLFFASLFDRSADLRRSSLIVFVAMALLSIPTFVSGMAAQRILRSEVDISPPILQSMISRHEGSAMLALAFMELTGAVSLIALWQRRYRSREATAIILTLVSLTFTTVGLMARTGNTGGEIRHSEILNAPNRAQQKIEAIIQRVEPDPGRFSDTILASKWWWASLMDLHLVGLVLIVGIAGVLNLRILGGIKQLPLAPLNRAIPWALLGLGINVITGMLAFIAQSGSYVLNAAFWLKITALMLLGFNLAIFYLTGISERIEEAKTAEEIPFQAKVVAAASLLLWFAVIALGRYLHLYVDTIPQN